MSMAHDELETTGALALHDTDSPSDAVAGAVPPVTDQTEEKAPAATPDSGTDTLGVSPGPRVGTQVPALNLRMGRAWRGALYRLLRAGRTRKLHDLALWNQPAQEPVMMASNHAPALSVLLADRPDQVFGYPVGIDLTTGHLVAESPHGLYRAGAITSPNVVILGDIGMGKSTLVKTELVRFITQGGRGVVFDRKKQWRDPDGTPGHRGTTAGEYDRLLDAVGGTQIVFNQARGQGTRLNILDPVIAATTGGDETSQLGQDRLLLMVTEAAMGQTLDVAQARALTLAHRAVLRAAARDTRVPELSDVVDALREPGSDDLVGNDEAAVARAGKSVALALARYVDGDLGGLIDGPTRGPGGRPVSLDAPLLSFDTSSLLLGSTALQVMMAVATAYVMSVWVNIPGQKAVVIEEGYSADGLGVVPATFRDLAKRSRGVGGAVWSVFHHISDIAPDSPLRSLITEAQVTLVFHQDRRQDIEQVVDLLGCDTGEVPGLLSDLSRGIHLRRRSTKMPIGVVQLVRSDLDVWVSDTDAAMRAG